MNVETINRAVEAESRADVQELLINAVDLHVHSGPAVMPRILDHAEAMAEAEEAGFSAIVYKDHHYPGMAHAKLLETLNPDMKVRLFSGVALNASAGGINPHAVDHALRLGAKIVWMPTVGAANHIEKARARAKNFPKSDQKMLDQIPLTTLDPNGRVSDDAKLILDLIAEADCILAGGHLSAEELHVLFEEAANRGVTKRIVNHPLFLVDCTDEDMRQLAAAGTFMEHEVGMFVEGKAKKYMVDDLIHWINVAGIERTVISSDLGLQGSPRPLAGYREFLADMLDRGMTADDITTIISRNPARLLNLERDT